MANALRACGEEKTRSPYGGAGLRWRDGPRKTRIHIPEPSREGVVGDLSHPARSSDFAASFLRQRLPGSETSGFVMSAVVVAAYSSGAVADFHRLPGRSSKIFRTPM